MKKTYLPPLIERLRVARHSAFLMVSDPEGGGDLHSGDDDNNSDDNGSDPGSPFNPGNWQGKRHEWDEDDW